MQSRASRNRIVRTTKLTQEQQTLNAVIESDTRMWESLRQIEFKRREQARQEKKYA